MAAAVMTSPDRLSATRLGNTTPLLRGSAQRQRHRDGDAPHRSFGQRLGSVDPRTQRLMVLQKKMQLAEAMEKRLRLDSKHLGTQRPLTPELLSRVGESVDGMLAMDSFWGAAGGAPELGATSSTQGTRASPSLFDTELLRASGRISVDALSRSPALALKAQELRSTGAIAGGRSGEASAARERRLRSIGALQSESLPELLSSQRASVAAPAPGPSKQGSSGGGGCRRRSSKLRRSQRPTNPMQEAQQRKLMVRAEVFIKRLVRDQMRELEAAFKLADTDGSGSLDELELRNLLYRFNIIIEDDHYDQLMRKIDQDDDGEISYREFLRYFSKGQAEDKQLVTKMTIVDVDEACRMIREKIEQRLESGPNGLRRAFRFFDKDMSGTINLKEFAHALKDYIMMEMDPQMVRKCFERFDESGTGELSFYDFTHQVMGSTEDSRTSLDNTNDALKEHAGDAYGTSEQMVNRKVRMAWRKMKIAFRDIDSRGQGWVTPDQLRRIFRKFDIDMVDRQFQEMCRRIDVDGDGQITYGEVAKYFGQAHQHKIKTVHVANGEEAIALIRQKTAERVASGANGLQRAFAHFDRDKSGTVSFDEFKHTLRVHTMLQFEEHILKDAFAKITNHGSQINFANFKQALMGVKADAGQSTSIDTRLSMYREDESLRNSAGSDIPRDTTGGLAMVPKQSPQAYIRERLRSYSRGLRLSLRAADRAANHAIEKGEETGLLPVLDFKRVLGSYGIDMVPESDLAAMLMPDPDGDMKVAYNKLWTHFGRGEPETGEPIAGGKAPTSVVGNITVPDALRLISEKLASRLEMLPGALGAGNSVSRVFKFFNPSGRPEGITREEFRTGLRKFTLLQFEESLFSAMAANAFRNSKTGDMLSHLSVKRFAELFMPSAQATSLPPDNTELNQIQLVRKIREQSQVLHRACRTIAVDGEWISEDDLRTCMAANGVPMSDVQYEEALRGVTRFEEDESLLSYGQFLRNFTPVAQRKAAETLELSANGGPRTIKSSQMSVEQGAQLIRHKLEELGLPSLRKTFQFIDRDGGGTLSKQEFDHALRKYLGLFFERSFFDQIFAKFDPDGSEELDLSEFTRMVMRSSDLDKTGIGLNDRISGEFISDENGNSDQLLLRKVRENMREISRVLKVEAGREPSSDGTLSPAHLRRVLERFDVMFADSQFKSMIMSVDEDNDGRVSIDEFLKFFGKGSAADKAVFATISGISAQDAKRMVQEKLQGRIEGGPSGLRRAYAFFDRDGSGSIDLDEFRIALETTCGLVFDDAVTKDLFNMIDPDGSGSLDFNEFCTAIMDSKTNALQAGTSLNTSAAALHTVDDKNCNSMQFLRRKVRENWKALLIAFTQHTTAHGPLDRDGLREILYRFDVIPAESQLDQLIREIDVDGDGSVDHQEFMAYWAPGQKEDLDVTGGTVAIGGKQPDVQKAKDLIRAAIEARLESGPGGLRRAFKVFDRDGSGEISTTEFRDMLKHHVMLEFDDATMAAVMSDFDPDNTGGIDFNEFCTLVMGESRHGPFSSGATANAPPPLTIKAGGDVVRDLGEKLLSSGQSATLVGKSTQLLKLLKLQDADGTGRVGVSTLRRSLARAGAPLTEEEISALASVIVEQGSGTVDYPKLTTALKTGDTSVFAANACGSSRSGRKDAAVQDPAHAGQKERAALWASAAAEAVRSPIRPSSKQGQNHGADVAADFASIASLPRALVTSPSKASGRRGSIASRSSRTSRTQNDGGRPSTSSDRSSRRVSSYRRPGTPELAASSRVPRLQLETMQEHPFSRGMSVE